MLELNLDAWLTDMRYKVFEVKCHCLKYDLCIFVWTFERARWPVSSLVLWSTPGQPYLR